MRPSKTRLERQAPANPYISEMELKQALQIQAAERKKALQLLQLQEKADLIKHYENYDIGNQNSNDEDFDNFLQKRKEEINVFDEELLEAQEMNKRPEYSLKKPHKFGVGGNDYENVNNFVQIEDHKNENFKSQGEIDREKRLKLREEERLRRLNGIKNSAYDGENGKISFEQQQALKFNQNQQDLKFQQNNQEKPKNEIFRFNSNNNNNIDNFIKRENEVKNEYYNEKIEAIKQNIERSTKNSQLIEQKKQEENSNQPNLHQVKKNMQNENFEKLVSREKQMKYKDELDRQIALKQKEKNEFQKPRAISANIEDFKPRFIGNVNNYGIEQNISPQNKSNNDNRNYPIDNNNNLNPNNYASLNPNQRPKSVLEFNREAELEKKKKYAEELKWQMDEKNQEKFYKKEQGNMQNKQNDANENLIQAKLQEKERKMKYAEELKQQMQEKNEKKLKHEVFSESNNEKIQNYQNKFPNDQNDNNLRPIKSYDGNIPNYNSGASNNYPIDGDNYPRAIERGASNPYCEMEIPTSNNKVTRKIARGLSQQEPPQGIPFLNKMEDENKLRENQRKNMKQNYQEDLKRQIDEKNRLKELEEKRLKEEEQREMEKNEYERQQMLQEEASKSKGRKPLNAILAENFEKKDQSVENPEKNEVNYYQNKRNEDYTESQEPNNKNEKQFTASFPPKTENKVSQRDLIYREENQYVLPPQEYPTPPQRSVDSRSNGRYVTYEEFDRQTKALKDAIEEKLQLEKLNAKETEVLTKYKDQVKEITDEKDRYVMEIEKLNNLLNNLHFAHENTVDIDFISKALLAGNEESRQYLEGMHNHLRESMQIVESLPTRSNLVYDGNKLDQSFRKDLEIFKAIHWNYFLKESQFIEKALQPPKTAPGRQTIEKNNPLIIQQTKFGQKEIIVENENDKFKVPLTQPQTQKASKTPKMFQSLLRSNTQETPKNRKNVTEIDQKMVITENLAFPEKTENLNKIKSEKNENPVEEHHLEKFLAEESEAQSYFVNSNNLDERKLPLPMHNKAREEEDYENEGFEIDEGENFEQENEIHMDEAKFNNEERSLVLADEELDEEAVGKFIESNEDKPLEIKPMSRAREFNNSSNSKIAKYKKPKTFDVFGKIQNTNFTNTNEESIPNNRHEKAMNRLGNYLDEVEKSYEK